MFARNPSPFFCPKYQAWRQEHVKNGFGTTLVGPVLTAYHYCVWKSGSVAGSSHVLRARLSLHHPFKTQFWGAHSWAVWKTVIVFTSHLDLTWDKGVELRFFQLGRPHSHRVWEAYQPQTTGAYSLDLTDCPRVADVYVKWLTWLDDGKCIETILFLGAWWVSNLGSGFGTTRAALA
ncbi:hypothetical protein TNCV_4754551 [Trichonephila clavipes]|nr:hypothetical protein TNCV_4754551 [Trichonephila clavipes]